VAGLQYADGQLCHAPLFHICVFDYTGWHKKRPEHLHALFSRVVELNQHKSIKL